VSAREQAGVAGGEGEGAAAGVVAGRGVVDRRGGGDAEAQTGEALVVLAGEEIEEQADAQGIAGGGVELAAEQGAGGVGAVAQQQRGAGEGVAAGQVGRAGGGGGGGGVARGGAEPGRGELGDRLVFGPGEGDAGR